MPVVARAAQRAHASTLLDLARLITASSRHLPMTQETFKAQRASQLLERAIEEVIEVLK